MKTRLSLAIAFLLMMVQGLWAQTPMTPAGENTWTAPMPAYQILLHAEYWDEYVISYELNGGINHEENPVKYYEDQEITLKQPTKEGYVFTGWTGSNGEEPQIEVTIAKGSTENKSYTAHWTAPEPGPATAIDNTAEETKATKRIANGQLLIEREGKLYNAQGAQVH